MLLELTQQLKNCLLIWRAPRITMQSILKQPSSQWSLFILAMIGGFANSVKQGGYSALLYGPLIGIAMLYIVSSFLYYTGKIFKGKGKPHELRVVVAWAYVPMIAILLLIFCPATLLSAISPEFKTFSKIAGQLLFNNTVSVVTITPLIKYIFYSLLIAEVLIRIWTVFIFVSCLSVVQQFSLWRAFSNLLLALTGVVAVFALLFSLFV